MMKKALTILFSSILAASAVTAQMTGDWGRHMMYYGYGGGMITSAFKFLLGLGILIIVWLWVAKLWKEVFHGKK